MEALLTILETLLGELWKKFCSLLPSPIEVSSREYERSDMHLVLPFYLRNTGTTPVKEYSLTAHLPMEVARHLRSQNSDEIPKPRTVYSTGSVIYNDDPISDYERSRGLTEK